MAEQDEIGAAQARKLLMEFLLALELNPDVAGRYADKNQRDALVDEWKFPDPTLVKALKERDVGTVEGYMNPGSILMKGWVKSPSS